MFRSELETDMRDELKMGKHRRVGNRQFSAIGPPGRCCVFTPTALPPEVVRREKLARLQAQVGNGTYCVAASDIADSLMASMLGKTKFGWKAGAQDRIQ